jgi:hypothetical protein
MGGGGVKNYQKLRDVIYGRPRNKSDSQLCQGIITFISIS